MWGDRSGREPTQARSPLAFRRVIAIFGSAVCLAGFIIFMVLDIATVLAVILLVMAIIGIIDIVVITRRLRHPR